MGPRRRGVGADRPHPAVPATGVDDVGGGRRRLDRGPSTPRADIGAVGHGRAPGPGLGAVPEVVVAERLHCLDVLRPPGNPAPTRLAGDAERDLLWAWLQAFRDEAVPNDPPPDRAPLDAAVDEERVVIAVPDGGPVAYAAVSPSLMRSSRIAPVYTPPAHRGHGYGAAVTAAAARIALERGDEEVLLFTDLANPTSNRLYARLGFVGVADIVDAALMPVARMTV